VILTNTPNSHLSATHKILLPSTHLHCLPPRDITHNTNLANKQQREPQLPALGIQQPVADSGPAGQSITDPHAGSSSLGNLGPTRSSTLCIRDVQTRLYILPLSFVVRQWVPLKTILSVCLYVITLVIHA